MLVPFFHYTYQLVIFLSLLVDVSLFVADVTQSRSNFLGTSFLVVLEIVPGDDAAQGFLHSAGSGESGELGGAGVGGLVVHAIVLSHELCRFFESIL